MLSVCIATLIIDMTTISTSRHKTSWIESVAILIVIFLCCFISAGNDHYKEVEFNKLHNIEESRRTAAVIREN